MEMRKRFAPVLVILCFVIFSVANCKPMTKFPITPWNTTETSGKNEKTLIEKYVAFANSITFENPIENSIVKYFSDAFKDKRWCYGDYPCFQIGGPFISNYSPISLPPDQHLLTSVKMQLFTNTNINNPYVIDPNDFKKILKSPFKKTSKTKVIIGGYFDGFGFLAAYKLIPPLLAYDDYNVFHVNWFIGSLWFYPQVAANARLVGAITARFIENISNLTGIPLEDFHVIGLSLGAHAAGHVGQYLNGRIGRISGLDPAGPFYEKTDRLVRLDDQDAILVDILHTNKGSVFTLSFGIDQKIGDIDFYPNGGASQTGCPFPSKELIMTFVSKLLKPYDLILDTVNQIMQCNHARAVYLFAESIKRNASCQFKSYACESYEAFLAGQCHQSCVANGEKCAMMGFHADDYAAKKYPLPSPYKFYLTTTDHPPYCNL